MRKRKKEKGLKIGSYLTAVIWIALVLSLILSETLFAVLDYFFNIPRSLPALGWLLIFNTLISGIVTAFLNGKILAPISAIEGYTTLLQGEELSMEQEECIDKILFNTRRLSDLVGNILLLSRLENQNIPMKKETYRLDEQIRQAILALEPKWTEKEMDFQVDMENICYTGNEGLLMHIWINLLDNAIKFSPEKGRIQVSLKKEGQKIRFSVADDGPGITPEVKNRMFDKFYQSDGSHRAEGRFLPHLFPLAQW